MAKEKSEAILQNILDLAEVRINGGNPWDITVHNPNFFARVLAKGSMGLGESYMDGWWDCQALDELIYRILKACLDKKVIKLKHIAWPVLKAKILNLQARSRAYEVGEKHYDIGNDLYQIMLDKRMIYSCGYWKNAKNLDQAQEAKLDLICRKVGLKPGMKILDIGCGWGGFAKYAAEKYGVKAVGVTISKEQAKLAKENCQGLPIEIRLQDYRNLNEKFDYIISIGMFEHVGPKNYREYFKCASRCLKENGLFLLHTIGGNISKDIIDPWVNKYIFPNAVLPSASQVAAACEKLFIIEDWHNFGVDYDRTLMAWRNNFIQNWGQIKNSYDKKFFRMWEYYLLSCAGSFRSRKNQLWQIVFSRRGVLGGYQSLR